MYCMPHAAALNDTAPLGPGVSHLSQARHQLRLLTRGLTWLVKQSMYKGLAWVCSMHLSMLPTQLLTSVFARLQRP